MFCPNTHPCFSVPSPFPDNARNDPVAPARNPFHLSTTQMNSTGVFDAGLDVAGEETKPDPLSTLNNPTLEQAFLAMNRDEQARHADRNLREVSHTPGQVRAVGCWPCLTLGIVILFATDGLVHPSVKRRHRYGCPLEHAELGCA